MHSNPVFQFSLSNILNLLRFCSYLFLSQDSTWLWLQPYVRPKPKLRCIDSWRYGTWRWRSVVGGRNLGLTFPIPSNTNIWLHLNALECLGKIEFLAEPLPYFFDPHHSVTVRCMAREHSFSCRMRPRGWECCRAAPTKAMETFNSPIWRKEVPKTWIQSWKFLKNQHNKWQQSLMSHPKIHHSYGR
jgi:hypothetical protein